MGVNHQHVYPTTPSNSNGVWECVDCGSPLPAPMTDQRYRGYIIQHSDDEADWAILDHEGAICEGQTLRENPFAVIDNWLDAK